MRLSLMKGADAALSGAAYRKFWVSRWFFAKCGRPRTLTFFPTFERSTWRAVVSHISRKTSEIWGTPRFLEGKKGTPDASWTGKTLKFLGRERAIFSLFG